MASFGVLLWLLLNICQSGQNPSDVFVKLDGKDSLGQYGKPSVVECVIRTSQNVKDLTVDTVVWKKDGSVRLTFHNTVMTTTPGYSFAEPSWNNKSLNVSLLIANTTIADHGSYSCMAMTSSGTTRGSANLHVTSKYNRPSIHTNPATVTADSQVTLTCRSEGGYPEGRLAWSIGTNAQQDGRDETVAKEMRNGLFNLSNELILSPGRHAAMYTCMVFNASGGKDDEASVTLLAAGAAAEQGQAAEEKGLDVATKVVAPLVVIGSLIVGLLLFRVLREKCSKREQDRQPETDPEQGSTQENLVGNPDCQETSA